MGSLLFAGWKLAGSPSLGLEGLEGQEIETEELTGVISKEREDDGQGTVFEKREKGIDDWFGSVKTQLAVQASFEEAPEIKVVEKKELAKRPVVSSQPITADARVYQQWMKRKDVLVMVAYYADW